MASSGTPTRPRVTTLHIDSLKKRRNAIAEIAAGRLPTLEEIFSGMGFARGDWKSDCRLWSHDLLLGDKLTFDAKDCFVHLRDSCTRNALEACRIALEHEDFAGDILERLNIYLAADNCPDAHARVVRMLLNPPYGRPDFRRVVFGMAVARSHVALCKPDAHTYAAENVIQGTAADIAMALEAARMIAAMAEAQTPEEALHEQIEENVQAMLEDRAEIETRDPEPVEEGIVVVPVLPEATGFKKSIYKVWAEVAGKPIPTIKTGPVGDAMNFIAAEMPHCGGLAVQIAMALQQRQPFHLRPILLVGEPGEGKTTLAKLIGKAFGVPSEMHNFAGSTDSSLGGTSAQWGTARESEFLQLVRRENVSNPIIIIDEIEKASHSRHNGSALDVVLPLLEKHTAARYRDPALEVEVDLSGVTVIATANSMETIPAPLRDRFTVYRMPSPEWKHVGALSRSILNKIAEERLLRPEWFPDLAGDEIEVIGKSWRGGSIRKLERAVRIIVEGRDSYMGRA